MKSIRNLKSRILIVMSKSSFSSIKLYITFIILTVLNGDLRAEQSRSKTEVRTHACGLNFKFFVTYQKITKAGMAHTYMQFHKIE